MTDDLIKLGQRAVACKGWQWMPARYRFTSLPDLTDPATLGCLLALVREAWSDPFLCAVGDPDTGWRIDAVTAQVQDLHGYASEAEALVSALEWSP